MVTGQSRFMCAVVHSGAASRWLHWGMHFEQAKTLLSGIWIVAIGVTAMAAGITEVSQWLAIAGVAIAPPIVARMLWQAPTQTLSESIQEARR